MSLMLSKRTEEFWRWFSENSKRLQAIRSAEDPQYAELERGVARISEDLGIEVGGTDEAGEMFLVFTAHGNENLFSVVDSVVQAAPKISGWQICALKPPLLEDLEVQYEGEVLRLSDLWFKVTGPKSLSGKLPLEIAINKKGQKSGDQGARENAALLVLESFLGERAYASAIEVTEFVELSSGPGASEFAPVRDLAEILGIH
jgi:hypothetical protein